MAQLLKIPTTTASFVTSKKNTNNIKGLGLVTRYALQRTHGSGHFARHSSRRDTHQSSGWTLLQCLKATQRALLLSAGETPQSRPNDTFTSSASIVGPSESPHILHQVQFSWVRHHISCDRFGCTVHQVTLISLRWNGFG